MKKIFIDANVLFTAAYSRSGKAAFVIENMGPLVITSDYAAEEARRNLSVKKIEALPILEKLLSQIKIVSSAQGDACPIDLPEKDKPIFLSALRASATHLLTGDLKDFGQHMNKPDKCAGIMIQTVADFLAAI